MSDGTILPPPRRNTESPIRTVYQNFILFGLCMYFTYAELENLVKQGFSMHTQNVAHIRSAYAMKFHHAKRMAIELMIRVNKAIAGMRTIGYFIKP